MKSTDTMKIRTYIVKLIENIGRNKIPDRFEGKKVSPPLKKQAQNIKNAQGEVLTEVLTYIDKNIHN